jgi:hypothetical protein
MSDCNHYPRDLESLEGVMLADVLNGHEMTTEYEVKGYCECGAPVVALVSIDGVKLDPEVEDPDL